MGYPAAKIRQFLEAIEPEVIIECPACQTKFRVEASKLLASGSPSDSNVAGVATSKARFHCSRCDYVFAAEIQNDNIIPQETSKMSSDTSSFKSEVSAVALDGGNTDASSFNSAESAEASSPEVEGSTSDNLLSQEQMAQEQLSFNFSSLDEENNPNGDGPAELASGEGVLSEEPVPVNIDWPTDANKIFIDGGKSPVSPSPFEIPEDLEITWATDSDSADSDVSNFSEVNEPADSSSEVEHTEFLFSEDSTDAKTINEISEIESTRYLDPDSESPIGSGFDHETDSSANFDSRNQNTSEDVDSTRIYSEIPLPWAKYNEQPFSSRPNSDQSPVDYSRYAQDFSHEEEDLRLGLSKSASDPKRNTQPNPIDDHGKTNTDLGFGSNDFSSEKTSSITTLAFFGIPLILLFSALGYLTYHFDNNLKSSEKLLSAVFPDAMREVPAGVFIQQPKIERLILDSGDIINVVSGTIINQSDKTLSAIEIEGLGFSDSGRITTSERIQIGNPVSLNNTNLKTLTPSNIRELQSKSPKKSLILRPEGKREFVLAFTKPQKSNPTGSSARDKDSEMSSFAVRVYSARFN